MHANQVSTSHIVHTIQRFSPTEERNEIDSFPPWWSGIERAGKTRPKHPPRLLDLNSRDDWDGERTPLPLLLLFVCLFFFFFVEDLWAQHACGIAIVTSKRNGGPPVKSYRNLFRADPIKKNKQTKNYRRMRPTCWGRKINGEENKNLKELGISFGPIDTHERMDGWKKLYIMQSSSEETRHQQDGTN